MTAGARTRTAALILLALAPPAAGQPPGDAFTPRTGHFSAHFPGKPKEHMQSVKSPAGELKVYTATYAAADGSAYLVSWTEFPAEAVKPEKHADLFAGARNGLAGPTGKVVSEADVAVGAGKVPGREFVIDKGKQQTRFRVAVMKNRLFQVGAVGAGEFVTGGDATAFLDSFEFVK